MSESKETVRSIILPSFNELALRILEAPIERLINQYGRVWKDYAPLRSKQYGVCLLRDRFAEFEVTQTKTYEGKIEYTTIIDGATRSVVFYKSKRESDKFEVNIYDLWNHNWEANFHDCLANFLKNNSVHS